jgi:hypothetical protein
VDLEVLVVVVVVLVEAKVDLEVIEMTMTNLRVDLVVEIRVDLEEVRVHTKIRTKNPLDFLFITLGQKPCELCHHEISHEKLFVSKKGYGSK